MNDSNRIQVVRETRDRSLYAIRYRGGAKMCASLELTFHASLHRHGEHLVSHHSPRAEPRASNMTAVIDPARRIFLDPKCARRSDASRARDHVPNTLLRVIHDPDKRRGCSTNITERLSDIRDIGFITYLNIGQRVPVQRKYSVGPEISCTVPQNVAIQRSCATDVD